MSETSVHVVIADVGKGDRPHASSAVNVPTGAGLARSRAAASSECCRLVKWTTRDPVVWVRDCRAPTGWAKARPDVRTRRSTFRNHRGRDGGTGSSSGGVNWGPSAGRRAVGIRHKPTVFSRGADVAVVSDEADGQNNRRRSQGPLDGSAVSEGERAAWTSVQLRGKRARRRSPRQSCQSRREPVKGWIGRPV